MKTKTLLSLNRRAFLQATSFAALGLSNLPAKANSQTLQIYSWDGYFGDTVLDAFTRTTGISVRLTPFASLDEMFAKLRFGNPGYDLIVPGDQMIETLHSLVLLESIDHTKLPNFQHIGENFLNSTFDPACRYHVPYTWGMLGVGYRHSKISQPTSWQHVLASDRYTGRIALLNDSRYMLAAALIYLGYSVNSTQLTEINAARDLLIQQKRHIKMFAPDTGQDLLLSQEVDLAVEWNGDLHSVMIEDTDLAYIVPAEGTIRWVDGLCIPKGAPNPDLAYTFIDYVMQPEVNAQIMNEIHFATCNKAAKAFINKRYLVSNVIYPPDDVIARSQTMTSIGAAIKLYDDAWNRVMAA